MSAAEQLAEQARPATVALEALNRDPELACRAAGVSKATAAEYAEAMKAGALFPPVVVFVDSKGVHWLADGFHRCAAAELAGFAEVAADVREGSRKDALLHAASANASHGLRRTNADKRRAVLLVLSAYPKWSDRKIAEACGVDHKTVSAARRSLEPAGEIPHSDPPQPNGEFPQGDGSDVDNVVQQLSAELQRVLKAWPAERQADLCRLLDAALDSLTRP